MIEKIKKLFLTDPKYIGAVLFGSQLNSPKPDSDTDIVLFTAESVFIHKIHKIEGSLFDVFEMSLEQAFDRLRLREPLWLSAFSTGHNVTGVEPVTLLLQTARQIKQTYRPQLTAEQLTLLTYALESCYYKLSRHQQDSYFYLHYSNEFIHVVKKCLFYVAGIQPCSLKKQMDILMTDFGEMSTAIKTFLIQTDIVNKQQLTDYIYNNVRVLLPDITYPILLRS
ncbi:putative nucleotidyltransferase [Rheinheimera pacifica]|uniref:nucleotidyltransferase domain-containing protein n=1 Tax=Rheinheimera pacifica TaxID=173990 RepID=UPI0021677492|nr:nucleotidyltransferase domain-containing protein [Rheinheimera pacifica]MCS4309400.1 putative nucleotidyltransferase [Rheinheimera pacifica]